MTAAHDHDDLHNLAGRLAERQAERLCLLIASAPELAAAARPGSTGERAAQRHLSVTGIWESGHGDLPERHDQIAGAARDLITHILSRTIEARQPQAPGLAERPAQQLQRAEHARHPRLRDPPGRSKVSRYPRHGEP